MNHLLVGALVLATLVGCGQPTNAPRQTNPVGRVVTSLKSDAKVLDEIDVLVRSSFWDRDEICKIVCEEKHSPGELDQTAVLSAIDSSIESWRTSQADWPEVTDCDRLDQAFAKLNELGVVAVHNVGDAQPQGFDRFHESNVSDGTQDKPLGYCFYHGMELERVVRGGPLHLSFGAREANRDESEGAKVAQIIDTELSNAGLTVEWDCRFANRVCIPNFQWQRRAIPTTK